LDSERGEPAAESSLAELLLSGEYVEFTPCSVPATAYCFHCDLYLCLECEKDLHFEAYMNSDVGCTNLVDQMENTGESKIDETRHLSRSRAIANRLVQIQAGLVLPTNEPHERVDLVGEATQINLRAAHLVDLDIMVLAGLLQFNQTCKWLILSDNLSVGKLGFLALAEMLRINRSITYLDIRNTRVTPESSTTLALSLVENTILQTIMLSEVCFSFEIWNLSMMIHWIKCGIFV
jgi:hypothetical protein